MKKILPLLFLIAFGFLSIQAGAAIQLPVPEIETLPNGLKLVWFLNDNLPVIDLALLVGSGYRDDAPGKSGTAELLSNVLDRGSTHMTAQEIALSAEKLGATRYVSADEDTFSVGMHGLAPDAPVLLSLLSDIALHPSFPDLEVKREHERLLDRWSHIADYGETLVSLVFGRIITSDTSYGRGSFSSIQEFKNVGKNEILNFHKKNFTPKNSILMVVGRVDKTEFRKKILTAFGAWTGDAPKHQFKNFSDRRLLKTTGKSGTLVLIDRPNLTQAQVRIGFKSPLIQSPDHYALVVANALLGEYFNSRLNSLIRDKLGLTYSIASAFVYSKDFASFGISSATQNQSVGQLIEKCTQVLKELKKGPIPNDEVQMAKDYLVGGFPLSTATLGAVASRWLGGTIYGLGPNYLNEFVPRVNEVTPADVLKAVKKDFDLDHLVIVVAGNSKEIEKSLVESKSKIRRVSMRELQ